MVRDQILIITALAVLTILIFIFAIAAFRQTVEGEASLVKSGARDAEIAREADKSNKRSARRRNKVLGVFLRIILYTFFVAMVGVAVASAVIRSQGDLVFVGDKTFVAIASNSMSLIGDPSEDSYNQKVEHGGHLTQEMIDQEFWRGDILTMESLPSEDALIKKNDEGFPYVVSNGVNFPTSFASDYLNKVFAFRYQGITVVHRLVSISDRVYLGEHQYLYTFQGDRVPSQTQVVTYKSLKAVYDGHDKVERLGYSVLFLGSGYGIYSIIGAGAMIIISTYYGEKIDKLYRDRLIEAKIIPTKKKKDGKKVFDL